MKRVSVIPAGLRIAGDVEGSEDLLVLGAVEGGVRIAGSLVVEESGVVHGDVEARSLVVRGVLVGDGDASEWIRVDAQARMVGDVRAPRVSIVEGARFRGRVIMTSTESPSVARVPRSVPPPTTSSRSTPPSSSDAEAMLRAALHEEPSLAPIEPSASAASVTATATSPGTARAPHGAHAARRPPPPLVPAVRRQKVRRRDA